jgi:Fur family peroxide stress response transcriptional regulator
MFDTSPPISTDQDSGVRLHQAGMRSTLPRRAILDAVMATEAHRSAEEVRRALADQGIELPRSSVNNVLGRLAAAGLIGRVDTLPGPTRFERDASLHHHFWCTGCRLVADVPAREVDMPPLPGRLIRTAVTYMGTCTACSEQPERSTTP